MTDAFFIRMLFVQAVLIAVLQRINQSHVPDPVARRRAVTYITTIDIAVTALAYVIARAITTRFS